MIMLSVILCVGTKLSSNSTKHKAHSNFICHWKISLHEFQISEHNAQIVFSDGGKFLWMKLTDLNGDRKWNFWVVNFSGLSDLERRNFSVLVRKTSLALTQISELKWVQRNSFLVQRNSQLREISKELNFVSWLYSVQ